MAYTPGVARVSRAIAEDPEKVWNLTIKQNAVAGCAGARLRSSGAARS
jgi:malic enzyme